VFAARSAQGCLRNSFQHFGLHTVTVVVHGDSRGIDSDRFQHQTRGHLANSRTLTQRLSKFLTFGSLKAVLSGARQKDCASVSDLASSFVSKQSSLSSLIY